MTISTKLDEKLEGVDNFRAWKYRVMLVLEENDLEGFIVLIFLQVNVLLQITLNRSTSSFKRYSMEIILYKP